MDEKELKDKLRQEILDFVAPVDFEKLFQTGLLTKIGRSVYAKDIQKLPKSVTAKITAVCLTKHGSRLTFSKGKLSKRISDLLK